LAILDNTRFSLAAINAIKSTFPASVVKGCTFHFRQAISRKVQSVRFSTLCVDFNGFHRFAFHIGAVVCSDEKNKYEAGHW